VAWTERDLVTLGYVAIRPRRLPADACGDYLVCSPASCIVDEPVDWPLCAPVNAVWMCDSIAALDSVLSGTDGERFLRLGLRGLPEQIGPHRDGWQLDWLARDVAPTPIPPHFVRLGYDVASRFAQSTLEHSPLSCNGYADELGANRYCLFETLDAAIAAAGRFAAEDTAEPGPYVVLEVWAERLPMDPLAATLHHTAAPAND
jgi:hypothetical protein